MDEIASRFVVPRSGTQEPDPLQLTHRQLDCLRLVGRGMSSKEIAGELGISHHTVDLHLKRAIRILGATSRRDAARRVESAGPPNIQHLATQADAIAEAANPMDILPNVADGRRPAVRVPFLRQGRRRNDLSTLARLGWIAGLAFAMMIAVANFLNGLGALYTLTD